MSTFCDREKSGLFLGTVFDYTRLDKDLARFSRAPATGMTKFTQMAANEDEGQSRRRIHLREISGDSDSPLETVGQDLRAARIRRGDDLAAVSRALKIRKDHLDAVENDRLDDLPGKTYAIGFVRSYARYLGLDAAELTERFKAEISGRGEDHALPANNLHDDEARKLPYGWRILGVIVGIALLYGIWHIFFAARDRSLPVPPPPNLARIIETPKPAPAPPAADTAPAPAVTTQLPPAPPPPAAQPAAKPIVAPLATATTAMPAVPGAPQPGASAQAMGQPGSRVVLRARENSRITIKYPDGRIFMNRDINPGDVIYVPNQAGLNMALSNAAAVEAALDGKVLGPVGQERQVLGRVSLDPQSLADRFNGH
jgi:cytoskeleton protein RodZ